MRKTVTIEDARKKLGNLVDAARLKGDHYIISKKGKPSAAIVPLELVQRHEESKKTLLYLIEEIHERNKGKKPKEIEALIDEAVKWTRRKHKT